MAPLAEFEGEVESALRRLANHTAFCDALVQEHLGQSVRADSRSTNVSADPRMRGVVFRAWAGDRWLEGSSSDLSKGHLSATVERLESRLAGKNSRSPPPGSPSTTKAVKETRPAKPLADLGTEGTVALAKEAVGWVKGRPSISEVQIRIAWGDDARLYLNSAGARCGQIVRRALFFLVPIAMENGRAEFEYLHGGGEGGQEILGELTEAGAHTAAESARKMLSSKAAPTGEMNVILDPSVAGLFAHESFGHGTEADQFLRDRSYLKPILGSTVGPDFLTIADDGAAEGAWGSIFFDDEGHPGQKNRLVDHGRFTGALHDSETAAAFSTKATGNTRRADFLSRAFVRMTNTYVEPGELSFEELIAEAKDGVVLEHGRSGIEDPMGGQMQLKVSRGHLIENGKITDLVSSMALSGSVLRFLKDIRGVGRSTSFAIEPGFCGKGHSDYIPVGTGGAHLLSRAVVGPA